MIAEAAFGAAVLLGTLPLPELSGLAVGERGVWAHEDSGSDPVLSRVDPAGRVLQRYRLRVGGTDWEDLAAAPDAEGTPSLWVADVGDNRAAREQVQVHRVAESDPEGPVTTYRFRYEDGPHDAEALLVLPGGQRLALVTKSGAAVYAGDLDDGVLRRVADLPVRVTGTPGGPLGALGQLLVTGGAVSPDGRRVAVRTYTDLYEWTLREDLRATFASSPVVSALPPTAQGEAVAYERDDAVLVASEGEPAPVHRLTRAPRPADPRPSPTAPHDPVLSAPASSPSPRPGWPVGAGAAVVVLLLVAAVFRLRARGR